MKQNVLDKGFVEVIDSLGSDLTCQFCSCIIRKEKRKVY